MACSGLRLGQLLSMCGCRAGLGYGLGYVDIKETSYGRQ